MGKTIKIVHTPDFGPEVPSDIKDAWVGLRLPLSQRTIKSLDPDGSGNILATFSGISRFAVEFQEALRLLREQKPAAAEWYEDHFNLLHTRHIAFNSGACELEWT